jgi:hypothetical protein
LTFSALDAHHSSVSPDLSEPVTDASLPALVTIVEVAMLLAGGTETSTPSVGLLFFSVISSSAGGEPSKSTTT